jgi:hypothetical protein
MNIILIPIILILSAVVFLMVLLLTSYFEFIGLFSKNIHLIFKSVMIFFSFTSIFKLLVYKNIENIYSDIDKNTIIPTNDLDKSNLFYLVCINIKELICLNDKNIKSESKPFLKVFKKIVKAITSFDYFLSDIFKNAIGNNDGIIYKSQAKAKLIQYFNWINLSVSLTFASFIVLIFNSNYINGYDDYGMIKILLIFVFIRSFSRSFEIIYAFIEDVATKEGDKKTTTLDRYDRLSLAITSYIEIFISYSIFYYLWAIIFKGNKKIMFLDKLIKSIGIMSFTDVDFYNKMSVSHIHVFLYNTALALQIITSMVLIIFAIASYLSNDKNL